MSRQITILISGLTMGFSKKMSPGMDTVTFGATLDKSIGKLTTVNNLSHHRFDLDPSSPDEAEDSLASFKKTVRNGPPSGGQWDAHVIGLGLKIAPPLTELFEDMLNTIVSSSEGKSKLLFIATPDGHWKSVNRGFPELEMGETPPS